MNYSAGFNTPGYLPDQDNVYEFDTFQEAMDHTIQTLNDHGVKLYPHSEFLREVWGEEKLTPREFEFSIELTDDTGMVNAYWIQKQFRVGDESSSPT